MSVLILPGLHDSDAGHWQSRWEARDQTLRRLRQDDWETPRCADWMATLDEAEWPEGLVLLRRLQPPSAPTA